MVSLPLAVLYPLAFFPPVQLYTPASLVAARAAIYAKRQQPAIALPLGREGEGSARAEALHAVRVPPRLFQQRLSIAVR